MAKKKHLTVILKYPLRDELREIAKASNRDAAAFGLEIITSFLQRYAYLINRKKPKDKKHQEFTSEELQKHLDRL